MKIKAVNKHTIKFLLTGLCLTLLFIATSFFLYGPTNTAHATINDEINFQGKLTNPDGTNVTDGTYTVVFSFYTVSSGGANVWTESDSVTTSNGIFQVNLGAVTTLPGSVNFNSASLYLGIKVGTDAEMTPRIQMTAVPQAFNSDALNGLNSSAFAQLAANQTFTGTNTFQPTTNISSVDILQNSSGSFAHDVFDVQGSSGGANNFIQVTSTAANQGAVTIASLGANNLNLNSGSNTISVGATTILGTGALALQGASGTTVSIGNNAVNNTIQLGTTAVNTGNTQTIDIGNLNAAGTTNVLIGTGASATGGTTTLQSQGILSVGNAISPTINVQTATGGTIGIGNNAVANTVDIANANGANNTTVAIGSGVTGVSNTAGITIGSANAAASTTLIQGGNGATAVQIQSASGGTISIGNGGVANTIQIGSITGGVTETINIGTNPTASASDTVNIGSTIGGTTTVKSAGGLAVTTIPTGGTNLLCYNSTGNILSTCSGAPGAGSYIYNTASVQSANFFVQAATTGTVAGVLQAFNGGAGDILDLRNGTGAIVGSVGSTGNVLHETSTNSTAAFQIQGSAGATATLLTADTTNMRLGVDVTYAAMTMNTVTAALPAQNATPTVTPTGTAASTTYDYIVVAITPTGNSASSAAGLTTTGNASLSNVNYNALSWTAYGTATGYYIYRTVGGGTQGYIGYSATNSFSDTGIAATGSVPTAGGSLTAASTYFYKVTAIDAAGGETLPATEVSQTTTGSKNTIALSWSAVAGVSGYRIYRTAAAGASGTETYLNTVTGNNSAGTISYTDDGTVATSSTFTVPAANTAYLGTNISNNNLQLSVGGNGTETGQLFVGGNVPNTFLSTIATGTTPSGIVAQGNYVYETNNGSNNFSIYDISNPAGPVLVSTTGGVGSQPKSLYVSGHYLYVLAGGGGSALSIFDVTNPYSPVRLSLTSPGAGAGSFAIYVQGRYAYLTGNASGMLQIMDVSNPYSPVLLSTVPSGTNPEGIYVQGHYAYVTNSGSNNLVIFDVSNPVAPVLLGSVATSATPIGVSVQGKYAYVATNAGLFNIFDISNPNYPIAAGSLNLSQTLWSVVVQGRIAYLTKSNRALTLIDISDPYNPTLIGSVLTGAGINGPAYEAVEGRYAYVVSWNASLLTSYDLGGEYTQQLQAGGTETGTLQVDSNANVTGDTSIQGGLNVGQGLQVTGQVGVGGSINLTQGTLTNPAAPSLTTTNSVGTLTAGTYYYKVAAFNGSGISSAVASSPASVTISGSVNTNYLTWTAVTGASGYIVYESTNGTTWDSNTVSSSTLGIVDNGSNYTWTSAATPLSSINNGGNLIVGGLIQGTNSTGTNVAGSNLTIAGGTGTGTASGGNILIQVASPGTTGSGQNGLATIASFSGSNGSALFQNSVNSTAAFQVQNTNTSTLLGVDTLTTPNLITNSDFESSSLNPNWSGSNAALTQINTQAYQGNNSMQVVVSSNPGQATYTYNALAQNTYYDFSVYLKASGANISTISIGWTYNGVSTDCLTGQTIVSGGWTRFACNSYSGFQTPNVASTNNANVYIKDTAASGTFYVDAAQLETDPNQNGYSGYNPGGELQLNGVVNSPVVFENTANSNYAFQVQQANGTDLLNVNTLNRSVTIGNLTGFSSVLLETGTSGTIGIGNDALAQALSIGNTVAATTTLIQGGNTATAVQVQTATGGTISVGNNAVNNTIQLGTTAVNTGNTQTIDIGNLNAAGTTNVLIGTGASATGGTTTLQSQGILSVGNAISPTINVQTATGGTIGIGNNAVANTVDIANANGANNTTVAIGSGVTGVSNTAGITIGSANAAASTTLIQGGNGATAVQIQSASGGTISIGNGGVANTIQIGSITGGVTETINIGTNPTASASDTVNIGSTIGGTTTVKSAGGLAVTTIPTGGTNLLCYNSTGNILSTCSALSGGAFINNQATVQSANFFVQAATTGTVAGVLQAFNGGAGDILDLRNGTGAIVGSVGSTGNQLIQPSTNSTAAFEIQGSAGATATLLTADTTNQRLGVDVTYAQMTVPAPTAAVPTQSATPVVTPTGTTGGTSYGYIVIATGITAAPFGSSAASVAGTTATGNATLSNVNYNALSWTAYSNATGYYVYRSTGGGTQGYIGYTTTNSFSDTGLSATGSVPTVGGGLTASSQYYYKVTAIDSTGGETTPGTEVNATTTAINTKDTITLSWTQVAGAIGYRIYRTAAAGASGTETFLTSVTGNQSSTTMSYTDSGTIATSAAYTVPVANTAYAATNVTNTNNLALSVGGNGTPTGQLYVSGTVPTAAVSTVATDTYPISVYVQGRYAYIVNRTSATLNVYDVSNPASPVIVGSASTGTTPYSVYVQGRYAYVANFGSSTLGIYDVSNPTSPVSVGTVATGTNPASVSVEGRYAYVVNDASNTLQAVDVSNPANPVIVGNVPTGTTPYYLYVQGRYAYVANEGSNTLGIYDLSNPASPVSVGSVATGNTPQSVYVQGRYAYVGNNVSSTLQVIDVSNPANPVIVGSVSTGAAPSSLYVQGRYAYVTNFNGNTLQIIDVSNPANPVNVGSVTSGANPRKVYVQGRYAYVLDANSNNMAIFDLGGAYVQQLEAGGAELGTLQVDSNESIAGSSSIQGGLNIGTGLQVAGPVGINGSINLTANSLSTPSTPTVATSASTAAICNAHYLTNAITYYYKIAAVSGNSITASTSTVSQLTGTSTCNLLTWTAVAGATGYIVYESTNNQTWFSNNVNSSTLGIVDNGTTYTWTTAASPLTTTNNGGNLIVGGSIQGASTTGTNTAGSSLNITGGQGTGTGNGGNITFQVAAASTTGSTQNGLTTVATISGTNGSLTLQNAVNSTTAFVVQGSTGVSLISADTTDMQVTNNGDLSVGTNPGDRLFSDNFESGNLSLWQTETRGTGTITDDTTHARDGKYAAKIVQSGSGNTSWLQTPITAAVTNGTTLKARAYFYTGAWGASGTGTGLFSFAQLPSTTENSLYRNNTTGDLCEYTDSTSTTDCSTTALSTTNGWVEVEFDVVESNTTTGSFQAYINGVQVSGWATGNTSIQTAVAGNFANYAMLGDWGLSGQGTDTYWMDDYSLDSGSVGNSGSLNISDSLHVGGTTTFGNAVQIQSTSNSLEALQIQNATGSDLLNADTTNMRLGVDVTYAQMTVPASPVAAVPAQNTITSVTPTGGTGSTNYSYIVIANTATGQSAASAASSTATGVATLSSSTYNAIVWPAYGSATSYNIYRTVGGSTTGYIGSVPTGTLSFNDTGYGANGQVPAAGGSLTASSTYKYEITAVDSTGGETTPSGEVSGTTGVSTKTINVSWTASPGASAYNVYRTAAGGASFSEVYLATVKTNYFADSGVIATGTTTPGSVPSVNTAYVGTNVTNNLNQLSIGGNGTETGQVYISGTVPTGPLSNISTGFNSQPSYTYVVGRYVYLTNYNSNNLAIYDVSNPASPALISTVATGTNPTSVYVAGHYAYVTNSVSNTLGIYDVSDPATPVSVGSILAGNDPTFVYVQGRYAYVVNYTSATLQIFDVSNPAKPVSAGSVSTNTGPIGVYVQGRYAYVVTYNGGGAGTLETFDVSNPTSPTLAGSAAAGSGPQGVYVQGRYAYVANRNSSNIQIFDISSPVPFSVSTIGTGSQPISVYVQGRYAYTANYNGASVSVVDVSNPSVPSIVGTINSGAINPSSVMVSGRYAYVADGPNAANGSLAILDLGGEYAQQLEAGGTETGTLTVDTNAAVAGDATIQGGLNVGQSLQVTGNLGASGTVLLQNSTNSTSAFQVENSIGTNLLSGDTTNLQVADGGDLNVGTNTGSRLLSDNFESGNLNQWPISGHTGSSAMSISSTHARDGLYSAQFNLVSGSDTAYLQTPINLTGTTMRARAYFYATAWGSGVGQITSLLGFGDNAGHELGIYRDNNTGYLCEYDNGTSTDICSTTPLTITNAWVEIEFDATESTSATGSFQIYVNGVAISTWGGANTGKVTESSGHPMTTALLGKWGGFTGTPITYWMDDYSADNTNVGNSGSLNVSDTLHVGGSSSFGNNVQITGTLTVAGTMPGIALQTTTESVSNAKPQDIISAGHYIYVANYGDGSTANSSGFAIYDNSNPAAPTQVTNSPFEDHGGVTNRVQAMALGGHYLYTLGYDSTHLLSIYDVSNPTGTSSHTPTFVGSATLSNDGVGIAVEGNRAYVGELGNLDVFDISNPANPIKLATIGVTGQVNSVFVDGRYVYAGNDGGGGSNNSFIKILDTTTNTFVGSYELSGGTTASMGANAACNSGSFGPHQVYVQGKWAFATNCGNTKIDVFDVSNPANGSGSTTAPTYSVSTGAGIGAYELTVEGRYLYATLANNSTGGNQTLDSYDISQLGTSTPTLVGASSSNGSVALTVNGRYAYVGNFSGNQWQTYDLGGEYAQQFEAGGIESNTLTVDNDATISGNAAIASNLFVGQNLNTSGNVSIGGLLYTYNKITSGDPTGVAGAIYYSSGGQGGANTGAGATYEGKFRCFEGGQWKNCIGMSDISQRRPGWIAIATDGATTFNGSGIFECGGTSALPANNAQNESNYLQFSTTNVSGIANGVDTGANTVTACNGAQKFDSTEERWRPKIETRFRDDAAGATTTARYWFVLSSADLKAVDPEVASTVTGTTFAGIGATTVNVGGGLTIDHFACDAGNGANYAGTDMGVAVTNNHYYDMIVDWSNSGTVVCSISDNGGAFVSTAITTDVVTANSTPLGIQEMVTTLAASIKTISISYVYQEQN